MPLSLVRFAEGSRELAIPYFYFRCGPYTGIHASISTTSTKPLAWPHGSPQSAGTSPLPAPSHNLSPILKIRHDLIQYCPEYWAKKALPY